MHPFIDIAGTIKEFGIDPTTTPRYKMPGYMVFCQFCGASRKMSSKGFINSLKNPKKCRQCPEYKTERSEIAKRSNSSRQIRHEIYEPFLEDIKSGKKSFLEVAKILGKDDSTVCKFFSKNFGLKSKFGNKSLQEDAVYTHLVDIFGECERSIRYSNKTRHIADFKVSGMGFVEYDGANFFHMFKDSDTYVDDNFSPTRLNAQAYIGGEAYIRYTLLGERTGYCSVEKLKEYDVRPIARISDANEVLENCHPLGTCAGKICFGLYWEDKLIGVAKFGNPTSPSDNGYLELRRFFILDGTPRNAESWFLSRCEKMLDKGTKLLTFIHEHEKGSYLKALNWQQIDNKVMSYDFYVIDGKLYNKRTVWGWAKKIGLVEKIGTTKSKEVLVKALGGKKITMGQKTKFIKMLPS